jgi:lactate dehydrogenase-like 2-hydroxyacid dehydrogenase
MLLFSAPRDFDETVLHAFPFHYLFREVLDAAWQAPARELRRQVTAIVCSPAEYRYYDQAELECYPNLRYLATASTGTNHIDLAACDRRGVQVLSLTDDRPGLATISASAEWTFKLILEGLRLKKPYHELQGRRVGFVGFGRIGHMVADWCKAFGAKRGVSYDPYTVNSSNLWSTFSESDVVVVCCTLNDETRGLVNARLLRRLPADAVLVNTARGEVIDADALERVMPERPDLRVCVDVVHGEVTGTADASRERLRALGAYVTPHIAGETYESRTKAARIILGLLKNAQEADQTGVGSPPAGDLSHVY